MYCARLHVPELMHPVLFDSGHVQQESPLRLPASLVITAGAGAGASHAGRQHSLFR